MLGKMDSQHVNNLVHALIMHFVDSSTMLFHASHIGFSSGIMLLSVCFICSLSQVRHAVIPNYPHYILHLAQNSYCLIRDAGRFEIYL